MTADKTVPVFARRVTVRKIKGRRVHRTVTGSRNDDGTVTLEVDDEEIDEAAPEVAPPAAPEAVTRSPFDAAMGDPNFDFRWR
jgi:hypothetical protein